MLPKLIVGVDPGSRPGLAYIDVHTRQLWFESWPAISRSEIISLIASRGEPLIVATDRAKVPQTVRKIASAFSARLYFPKKDLSVSAKEEITRGIKFKNRHEKDAAASAIAAMRKHNSLLVRIDKKLEQKNLKELSPEAKALVIKHRMPVWRAIQILSR